MRCEIMNVKLQSQFEDAGFGGDGPSSFDSLGALEQWVEKGKAPEEIIASHLTNGKVDRTRPLCVYPKVAKYKGSGSTDDAMNFSCVSPN
jgi:feruloyl esterase